MDLYEVQRRVVEIYSVTYDDEKARTLDYELRRDVLVAVANGAPDAAKMAASALATDELGSCRRTT